MKVLDRQRREDEAGFALVFFALTVVALMMFTALAVDIGAGFDERREDVSAADGSVLGAMHEVGDVARRDKALVLAQSTLNESLSLADFNTCAGDPDALAVSAPSANCITFNTTRSRMRVRLPTRALSYFGAAAGLPEVRHTAAATAQVVSEGFGEILPFAFTLDQSGHFCLRSDSNSTPPCSGATSGSFGEADFSVFGQPACAGNSNPFNDTERMQFNVSQGVDHELRAHDGTTREDRSVCTGAVPSPANAVRPAGGLTPALFGESIMHGLTLAGTPYDGRLEQRLTGWWGYSNVLTVNATTTVDDNPLYEFLGANDTSSHPAACRRDLFVGAQSIQGNGNAFVPAQTAARDYINTQYSSSRDRIRVLMERCFAHFEGREWNDNDLDGDLSDNANWLAAFGADLKFLNGENRDDTAGIGCGPSVPAECLEPIFTRSDDAGDRDLIIDLQLSPRFGYTPQLDDEFDSNNELEELVRFRAVFLYRSCGSKCTGTGNNVWMHEPGFALEIGGNGNVSNSVGDLTGFVFSDNMLPNGLSGLDAPYDIGTNRFIQLVE